MATEPRDIAPESGMDEQVGLLLAMLDATTQKWRNQLGDVTEEALVWQPAPAAHSIGAVILHIADVEAHWLYEVAGGGARSQEERDGLLSDATDQYAGQWPTPPAHPLAWYYAQHDTIRERTRETLRRFHDAEQVLQKDDRTFTLRWLVHHVISHEAYHGGQAVLLASLYQRGDVPE